VNIARSQIGPNDPLRLDAAARLAFPDGSMTVSGLRREIKAGRLVIERVAGKDYTTLAEIERMRVLCRLKAKVQGSTCEPNATTEPEPCDAPHGSSATPDMTKPRAALHMTLQALKERSPDTSPQNTPEPRRASATVTHLKSRSRTC
jgi:hypothetical protein